MEITIDNDDFTKFHIIREDDKSQKNIELILFKDNLAKSYFFPRILKFNIDLDRETRDVRSGKNNGIVFKWVFNEIYTLNIIIPDDTPPIYKEFIILEKTEFEKIFIKLGFNTRDKYEQLLPYNEIFNLVKEKINQ